ncbi:MAG TPA: hypothetical protein VJR91_11355 [Burkholderia sp.]|nr:hypothetical protein [Burkholderia sp.]
MTFRWDQPSPPEWSAGKPPPAWAYVVLFLVIECIALGYTVLTWPKGEAIASDKFVLSALVVPIVFWLDISILMYVALYDILAFEAAIKNTARWNLLTRWQQRNRMGVAVLDTVIFTPEPDLAERMLKLEGSPPENPGKVMPLADVVASDSTSRVQALAEKLLTPLVGRLARVAKNDTFEIVIQCEHAESSAAVLAAWEKLELPGKPRIRPISNDHAPGFADIWFEDERRVPYPYASYTVDKTPEYRLLLAWHLNEHEPDAMAVTSEAAVALLFGSASLLQEKPGIKPQAWLLRQIVADADQTDRSLALLLRAAQVPCERIRHFWHSRLKGIAQHATLGAVRDTDLKVEEHALDRAIGPQAPVARWVLQALAAKMAHFGQGPQLIALPHKNGVSLNVVAKAPAPVDVPWKSEYQRNPFPAGEISVCALTWQLVLLLSPNKTWSLFETVFTCVMIVVVLLVVALRLFAMRLLTDAVWREYG